MTSSKVFGKGSGVRAVQHLIPYVMHNFPFCCSLKKKWLFSWVNFDVFWYSVFLPRHCNAHALFDDVIGKGKVSNSFKIYSVIGIEIFGHFPITL